MQYKFIHLITVIFVLITTPSVRCRAQDKSNNRHSRFHFAKSYIGLDFQVIPATGSTFYPVSTVRRTSSITMGPWLSPRLVIGGTHFWGRTDFFINIPLTTFTHSNHSGFKASYSFGVETGALIYPWKLTGHGLRPYVGFSWASIGYQQKVGKDQKGVSKRLSRVFVKAGLSFQTSYGLWSVGTSYLPNSSFSYALSRTQFEMVRLPRWSWQISYKYQFDTTVQRSKGASEDKPSGKNVFSIAIGPSTAFGLRPSSYNSHIRPYLDNPVSVNLFPDISLGYHFFDLDATVRISYRRMIQNQEAFGVKQHFIRNSISLEVLKFLFDYQGFVPYVGLFAGPEFLGAVETDRGKQTLNINKTKWTAGISAGWDIRPVPASSIVLRTNIRYSPFLSLDTPNGNQIRFSQLEVDFIQVVVYPRRLFSN